MCTKIQEVIRIWESLSMHTFRVPEPQETNTEKTTILKYGV